jgi:serine protease Do
MPKPLRPWLAWPAGALLALLLSAAGTGAARALPDFTELVERNSPAVVNVRTQQQDTAAARQPFPGVPEDSPLREFFERFLGPEGPGAMEPSPRRSLGSGFIISEDGYILTAAHVIAEAEQVLVRLSDHREKTARVVGADARSDVALLKIDAEGLPTVTTGDSEALEVGEWVLAIGSPFGLESTATQGIVSALGRNLPGDTYVPFIQTDVALNPGNSGGPLYNTEGEVVGISAQIFSQTGGYMGVSFAVPINEAMRVAEQLRTEGRVSRGWLGVLIQPVSHELAESFGLDRPRGALVADVTAGSPADRAGMQAGDVIVRYDGEAVGSSGELPVLVGATPAGDQVPVEVIREGERRTLQVTIGDLEAQAAAAPEPEGLAQLGVVAEPLGRSQRERLGIEAGGVLLTRVEPGGRAAGAGFRQGDVVLRVGGRDITTPAGLVEALAAEPVGRRVPVLVQREDRRMFLPLEVPPMG